jgi:N-acyl-phosphatidylethanolamine-hydrolysing phospholipase D
MLFFRSSFFFLLGARLLSRTATVGAAFAIVVTLAGCAAVNPYFDAGKPHHTPNGFKNNYIASAGKSRADLLKWRWQAWAQDLPQLPKKPTPVQTPDLKRIADHSRARSSENMPVPQITWVGHATMLVQAGGLNVLTDPMFSERASPFSMIGPKRAQAPGLQLHELPPIDVVLITHNHYDHLDEASVMALANLPRAAGHAAPLFVVPLGIKPILNSLGIIDVVELDWWDRHDIKGTSIHLTPAQHWSARSLLDRNESLWGGFAVFSPGFHWLYSGDTGYSKDFTDIRARFHQANQGSGFDLAMIPIGAYEPSWFMKDQHVDPADAVRIHFDLAAKRSVGVHWGTFNLTDESLDQPPQDLAKARAAQGLQDDDFFLMKVGETRQLPVRAKP